MSFSLSSGDVASKATKSAPKFRMPFSSPFNKWSRSHKAEPMSTSLSSSEVAPDEDPKGLAINLGMHGRSSAASSSSPLPHHSQAKAQARSVEEAVTSLGWYWNSKAETIWGPSATQEETFLSPTDQDADQSNRLRSRSFADIASPARAKVPSSLRTQRLATKSRRSNSDPPAPTFKSWSDYLDAYVAGTIDLGDENERPVVEGEMPEESHMKAPVPEWELARKSAICRAGIFDLPPSVLDRVHAIATRIKTALDMDIIYVDVLFNDEGYLIVKEGIKLHLSCRRDTLCAHTILNSHRGFTMLNRHRDWRFKDNPLIGHVGFYSGYPIRSGTGLPFGALCVMDGKPREDFSQEDKDMIRHGAQAVSRILEDNFAERFEAKMAAMGSAFEGVKASLRHHGMGAGWKRASADAKMIEASLFRVREATQLDVAYIVAIKDDAAQVIASAGSPIPPHVAMQAGFYSAALKQGAGYAVYQNELFDRAAHVELAGLVPSDGPQYSCALMVSLRSSASQQASGSRSSSNGSGSQDGSAATTVSLSSLSNAGIDFVLVAASTQGRHVLGVEDLRFLQSVKPFLAAAAVRQQNVPVFPADVGALSCDFANANLAQQASRPHLDAKMSPALPARTSSNVAATIPRSMPAMPTSPPQPETPAASVKTTGSKSGRSPQPAQSSQFDSQFRFGVDDHAPSAVPQLPVLTPSTIARSPDTGDYYFRIGAARAPPAAAATTAASSPPVAPRRPLSSKGEAPESSSSRPSSARGLGKSMISGVIKGSLSSSSLSDARRAKAAAARPPTPSSAVEFLALPPQSFMAAAAKMGRSSSKHSDTGSETPVGVDASGPPSPRYRFCSHCAGILPLDDSPEGRRYQQQQRSLSMSSPGSPSLSSAMQPSLSASPPRQQHPQNGTAPMSIASAASKTLHPGNISCTCPASNGATTWTPKNPSDSFPGKSSMDEAIPQQQAHYLLGGSTSSFQDIGGYFGHGGSSSPSTKHTQFPVFKGESSAENSLVSASSVGGGVSGAAKGLGPPPPKARSARATRRPSTASGAAILPPLGGRSNGPVSLTPTMME